MAQKESHRNEWEIAELGNGGVVGWLSLWKPRNMHVVDKLRPIKSKCHVCLSFSFFLFGRSPTREIKGAHLATSKSDLMVWFQGPEWKWWGMNWIGSALGFAKVWLMGPMRAECPCKCAWSASPFPGLLSISTEGANILIVNTEFWWCLRGIQGSD